MIKNHKLICFFIFLAGTLLQAGAGIKTADRWLVLTEKADSSVSIFKASPTLKISFEGEEMVILEDNMTTRVARENIAELYHTGATPVTVGIVADNEAATPLPEITVKLIQQETVSETEGVTDEEGKLCFPETAPGHYFLEAGGSALFEGYSSVSPFLHIQDSDIAIILKEIVKAPIGAGYQITAVSDDLYDLTFFWNMEEDQSGPYHGYEFRILLDDEFQGRTDDTVYEITGIPAGEHCLKIQGVSPYGSEPEPFEFLFDLESQTSTVGSILNSQSQHNVVFDLNGVAGSPSKSGPGVYIRQGEKSVEKVLVK